MQIKEAGIERHVLWPNGDFSLVDETVSLPGLDCFLIGETNDQFIMYHQIQRPYHATSRNLCIYHVVNF